MWHCYSLWAVAGFLRRLSICLHRSERCTCCHQVMVEGPNPRDSSQATGRTRHNKPVFFDASDAAQMKGKLVTVRIDKVHAYTLYGALVT